MAQDMVSHAGLSGYVDVAVPQTALSTSSQCSKVNQSIMICLGQTQVTYASLENVALGLAGAVFQKNRSRGCRRAPRSSLRCAWSHLLQLAQKKKLKSSMLTSLFRLNRPTPASTSKTSGRGAGAAPAQPMETRPLRRFSSVRGAAC